MALDLPVLAFLYVVRTDPQPVVLGERHVREAFVTRRGERASGPRVRGRQLVRRQRPRRVLELLGDALRSPQWSSETTSRTPSMPRARSDERNDFQPA